MATSLARQLAQTASLNAALFKSATTRTNRKESYIFSAQEAAQHDPESIHGLAYNAFLQLQQLDPRLAEYEDKIFSDYAKNQDRTLLSPADTESLNAVLDGFLRLLSSHLFLETTSRVLEWLVRHFRIHEFNVDGVLSCFLPYHESSIIIRMIQILHLKTSSLVRWQFLEPLKKTGQTLPRETLLAAMDKDTELFRFIVNLLPQAVEEKSVHPTLISFYTVTLLSFIKEQSALDENHVTVLLPALSQILSSDSSETSVAAYMLHVALARKTLLTKKAVKTILSRLMKTFSEKGSAAHLITALVAICASQEELDSFPKKAISALAAIRNVQSWLTESFSILGSELFLQPLITTMAEELEDERYVAILGALFRANNLPKSTVKHSCDVIARELASEHVSSAAHERAAVKELGSVLQQRYPDVFSSAVAAIAEEGHKIGDQLLVDGAVASFHDGTDGRTDEGSIVLAVYSADATARAAGVRRIVSVLTAIAYEPGAVVPEESPETQSAFRAALIARVNDAELNVLQAVYEDPTKLMDCLPAEDLYEAVKLAVSGDIHRKQLELHMTFASAFAARYPPYSESIFFNIFMPHLLLTKAHLKTGISAWRVCASSSVHELPVCQGLVGTVESVLQSGEDAGKTTDELAELNQDVVTKLAGNIISSDKYQEYVHIFQDRLSDERLPMRLLALLCIRALLSQLSGEHRLALAHVVVEFLQSSDVPLFLPGEEVAKNLSALVFTRSKVPQTLSQLHLALLLVISEIEAPANVKIDFLCDPTKVSEPDPRGALYVTVVRKTYQSINRGNISSPARLATLQRLFSSLKESVLLFLGGVWSDVICLADVRAAALGHARAFLRAQNASIVQDPQLLLPALLVALYDTEQSVLSAAVECLTFVESLGTSKPKAVYAVDIVYGSSSGEVQYLEWDDLLRYIRIVVEHSNKVLMDRYQLSALHHDALAKVKGEGKKNALFKDRIIFFLLSHVKAWRSLHSRVCLLEILSGVHKPIKLESMLPLLRSSVEAAMQDEPSFLNLIHSSSETVLPLLIGSYDDTVGDELNKPESEAWTTLLDCLRIRLDTDSGRVIFSAAVAVLQTELPKHLNRQRQLELLQLCIGLVVESEQKYAALKIRLPELLGDADVMVDLLAVYRPVDPAGQRPSKRSKQDDASSNESQAQLSNLTLLAEIISTRSFTGSVALVSALLESLGAVMNAPSVANLDVDYTQQQLLAAISSTAVQIDTGISKTSSILRIDLIVDLVRSTANPQTSRQALLTIANLAQISKESVLHNVMPIFTFMGSSVFQNDDAYSFTVIQRTVDSVVPVMAASLREHRTTSFDLYLRSRDFLRVFTDASNHIPRHRRVNFFLHLVDVLGPEDFLPPVCILLVDKVASKVIKQKGADLISSFTLPLACLNKRSAVDRYNVLIECLNECQRLRERMDDYPKFTQPVSFLDSLPSSANERAPLPRIILARQIHALLLFVGMVVDLLRTAPAQELPQLSERLRDPLSRLLGLSKDIYLPGGSEEIGSSALACIDKVMNIISVPEYATTLETMLQHPDDRLQLAAMSLLPRLNQVTVEARKGIAVALKAIIHHLVQLLVTSTIPEVRLQSLRALETVVGKVMPEEESVLSQQITAIVTFADSADSEEQARVLSTLKTIVPKLGPRLIPSLRPVVDLCTSLIRGHQRAFDATVCKGAFDLLSSLVRTLPNFMGSFTARILEVVLDPSLALPNFLNGERQTLLRTIAKEMPAKSLLPTAYGVWTTMTTSSAPSPKFMSMFFDMLQRAIRNAARADVLEQLRLTFKFFLEAFDTRLKWYHNEIDEYFVSVEGACVSAFMQVVVKLNETSFKPLFRRLYDWALEDQPQGQARQIVFYRFMEALLDQLKSIITPYMSIVLDHTIELLRQFKTGALKDAELWTNVVTILRKSFEFDEGAFWRDNTMSKTMPALADQIDACPDLTVPPYLPISPVESLSECLACMSQAASDDVAKALNLAVWMKSRSDRVEVRLSMLKVAQSIWKKDGERLSTSGYAAETVAFLVECLEDSSEAVENEARAFQRQLTKLVGPLEGLI